MLKLFLERDAVLYPSPYSTYWSKVNGTVATSFPSRAMPAYKLANSISKLLLARGIILH